MKKSIKRLLLIVILIIVAVIFYFVWITVFDTKWLDLKRATYENSRYNFSLKYPENWSLGETETNNAGRVLSSPENEVSCYAYGFANALTNNKGEPQTLDEFITWLTDKDSAPDIVEVVQREASSLAGRSAISLLIEQDSGYKKAIYTLGKETGIGFFCTYPNMETMNEYANEYGQMVRSFEITASLDGEVAIICDNLINGVITPFKDFQTFTDTNYTEVTLTSRDSWDKNRLPRKVTQLEGQGYTCYPMPLEFDFDTPDPGVHSEPAVTKVEWTCELEYNDWKYLETSDTAGKQAAEQAGFTCEKEECFTAGPMINDANVWLCTK